MHHKETKMAKKNGKQGKLPGTERKDRNPAIEKAASAYVDARDERMDLTEREVELQDALVIAMKTAKLTTYRCDDVDLVVEMSTLEKAKVRRVKDQTEDKE
jgi:hypothetical protein